MASASRYVTEDQVFPFELVTFFIWSLENSLQSWESWCQISWRIEPVFGLLESVDSWHTFCSCSWYLSFIILTMYTISLCCSFSRIIICLSIASSSFLIFLFPCFWRLFFSLIFRLLGDKNFKLIEEDWFTCSYFFVWSKAFILLVRMDQFIKPLHALQICTPANFATRCRWRL